MAEIVDFHEAAQALAMYWDLVRNGGLSKQRYKEYEKIINSKLTFMDNKNSKVESVEQ